MSLSVDINCDLGEGMNNEAEIMPFISSANIACGYHAGDALTMRRTIEIALEHGVAVGAHPSYDDRENFGRIDRELSPEEIQRLVKDQLEVFAAACEAVGTQFHHVKPHGALYNRSAADRVVAEAIARAVERFDDKLILFGLSGSESIAQARSLGLRTAAEVFADRTYLSNGTLTPRTQTDAMIDNPEEAAERVVQMLREGSVLSTDGTMFPIAADTVCIHGDGPHAVEFARGIRAALENIGLEVKPL